MALVIVIMNAALFRIGKLLKSKQRQIDEMTELMLQLSSKFNDFSKTYEDDKSTIQQNFNKLREQLKKSDSKSSVANNKNDTNIAGVDRRCASLSNEISDLNRKLSALISNQKTIERVVSSLTKEIKNNGKTK